MTTPAQSTDSPECGVHATAPHESANQRDETPSTLAGTLNRFPCRARVAVAVSLAATIVLPCSATAQLPLARLDTLFPPGGKAGSAVEVSVAGADLDEMDRLHFTNAGITAKARPGAGKFDVSIAPNTPPGIYEARVIGRFGISNPRAFAVGTLPELIGKPGNNSTTAAMEVPLGTTLTGTADANAADYFKFAARKGQRVLIECQAKKIDSRMEPALTLYSTEGRELERNKFHELLDYTIPIDGLYVLKIHDFLFRGGGEYSYRLTISTGPHIDFVLPPSGLPGSKGKYTLYGRNLPGGTPVKDVTIDGKSLEQLPVEIQFPPAGQLTPKPGLLAEPAQAVVDGFEYRLPTPAGVSNPVLLSFATAPVIAEQANNGKTGTAQKVALPCEFTGQFYPARDVDWITFDAKKGEVYWVEVFSQRLGLPTDPFVLVQRVMKDDKGQPQSTDVLELYDNDANLGGAEFKTTSLDPAARFEVKEDGIYRIRVQDLFNQAESDPRRVYRLSLRKEAPDFQLVSIPEAPPPLDKAKREAYAWTTLLRRGESIPVQVMAFRRDGFGGEIQLSATGLPTGVTCSGGEIESGKTSALLILSATDNAAPWAGPIKIVGKAKAGSGELAREARAGCVLWNVGDYNAEPVRSRLADGLFLAVTDKETAPITVLPTESKTWEAAAGAKLQIPLKIIRRGEFKNALKLKAVGLSALDKLKELEAAGAATNATLEIDLNQFKVAPGNHIVHLEAETKGSYRNNPEAAAQAEAALKAAEKAVADLAAEAKMAAATLPAAVKAAEEAAAQAKAIVDTQKEATAAAKAKTAAAARAVAEKAAQNSVAKAKQAEAQRIESANFAKSATDLATTARKAAETLAANAKAAAEAAVQARALADKEVAAATTKAKAATDAKTTAEKAAQEAAAHAKATADTLATSAKAAVEAAAQAKALADKEEANAMAKAKAAGDAKAAAEKASHEAIAKGKDAEAKIAAATNAAKIATDLTAAAKLANDALATAAKTAADAATEAKVVADRNAAAIAKAKATAGAKAALEKIISEAPAKTKEAEARKTAAAKLAKATAEKAKPRDVTIKVYSAPIAISVKPPAKK